MKTIIKDADKGSAVTIMSQEFHWNMCQKHYSTTEY